MMVVVVRWSMVTLKMTVMNSGGRGNAVVV